MPVEEVYAHTLNMCVGMVGVVSLLLATSLRPESGNPVSGVSIHTHRNHDVLFLGTKYVILNSIYTCSYVWSVHSIYMYTSLSVCV